MLRKRRTNTRSFYCRRCRKSRHYGRHFCSHSHNLYRLINKAIFARRKTHRILHGPLRFSTFCPRIYRRFSWLVQKQVSSTAEVVRVENYNTKQTHRRPSPWYVTEQRWSPSKQYFYSTIGELEIVQILSQVLLRSFHDRCQIVTESIFFVRRCFS